MLRQQSYQSDNWVRGDLLVRGPSPIANAKAYGAKGDGSSVADAVTTRNSTTITSASGRFSPSDVGKLFALHRKALALTSATGAMSSGSTTLTISESAFTADMVGCLVSVTAAGNAGGTATLNTTIATFISATQVTLAAPSANSGAISGKWVTVTHPRLNTTITAYNSATSVEVASAPATTGTGMTATWGTDDSAAIQRAIDAATAEVYFPGGAATFYCISQTLVPKSGMRLSGFGGVTLRRVAFDGVLFNDSTALVGFEVVGLTISNDDYVNHMFQVDLASIRTVFRYDRFVDIGNNAGFSWASSTAHHDGLTFDHCDFVRDLGAPQGANGEGENTWTMRINNCSNVLMDACTFKGTNAIQFYAANATACPATNPMRNIRITNTWFESTPDTNLWITPTVSGAYLKDVFVDNSTWWKCGFWVEKGAMAIGYPGAAGALMANVHIRGNTIQEGGYLGVSGGYAPTNAAQQIIVGSSVNLTIGVHVIGNTIDNADVDGTLNPAYAVGIVVNGGVLDGEIIGNVIRNCGYTGIWVRVADTQTVTDRLTIAGNTVTGCCTGVVSADVAAAIWILGKVTNVQILNNTCANNGKVSVLHVAGIGLGGVNGNGFSTNLITRPVIRGNKCYDDRGGSALQVYGIRLGYSGSTLWPQNAIVTDNEVWGNLTAQIFKPTTYSGEVIRNNSGYNPLGALTEPSVPATTVAQQNTFGVDCRVNITGGTVTGIAIDGDATGLTSGSFIVPAGSTITLTYSVAPTWTWQGL